MTTRELQTLCFICALKFCSNTTLCAPVKTSMYVCVLVCVQPPQPTPPIFHFNDIIYYFSMHYAAGEVMAAWLDTYFFVWPQNAMLLYFTIGFCFDLIHTQPQDREKKKKKGGAYHSHLHSNGLELARKTQFN